MATLQTSDNVKQLGQVLITDKEVLEKITAAPDQETWINMVIQFGEERGIKLTTQEVIEALKAKAAQRIDSGTGLEIIVPLGHSAGSAATSPV